MKPIVLIGHKHDCPLHGEGEVISGTSSLTVKGRAVALASKDAEELEDLFSAISEVI